MSGSEALFKFSMRKFPFLIRLGSTALGVVIVCFVIYAGLGWMLWMWPRRCGRLLGEVRAERLSERYARVLGKIVSKDSAGDGVTDGWKIYAIGHLPNATRASPALSVNLDMPGFGQSHFVPQLGPDTFYEYAEYEQRAVLLEPGEKRWIRAHLTCGGRSPDFVRGMVVLLESPRFVRLSPPNGVPAEGPLRVDVSEEGGMEFGIEIAADANPYHADWVLLVGATNGLSKGPIRGLPFRIGRRLPALPCEVLDLPPGREGNRYSGVDLRWTPNSAVWLHAVEVTRDPARQTWYTIGLCTANRGARAIFEADRSDPQFRGPTRFRVVPLQLDRWPEKP